MINEKPANTIHDLYPDLSEKELAEAQDTLERYLALVLRIFERREAEGRLTPGIGTLPCTSPEEKAS